MTLNEPPRHQEAVIDIGKEKPAIIVEPAEVPIELPVEEPRPVEEPAKPS